MINKKICLLGSFAVGKTAIIKSFIRSEFDDAYLSTVGVRISRRQINIDQANVEMTIWDLEGRDAYGEVNLSYLKDADGLLLVADGTRKNSLRTCMQLKEKAFEITGHIPYLLLVNKFDIHEQWGITFNDIIALQEQNIPLMHTSAKTSLNVDDAFGEIGRQMLKSNHGYAGTL